MTERESIELAVREGPMGEEFAIACLALSDMDEESGKDGFHWRWMGGKGIRPAYRDVSGRSTHPWGWYWAESKSKDELRLFRERNNILLPEAVGFFMANRTMYQPVTWKFHRNWHEAVEGLAAVLRMLRGTLSTPREMYLGAVTETRVGAAR